MECSCEFNGDVDCYSYIIDKKYRKAKKNYKCCECRRVIKIGDKHMTEKLADSGEISTYRTCIDCMSLRDNLVGDFYYGSVRELIHDNIFERFGDVPEKCIASLTPAARDFVCDEIESVWEWWED